MVKICEVVNGCEDCPKYGDDCDGETDRMSDYISRADAIEAVCDLYRVVSMFSGGSDRREDWYEKAEKLLSKCPSAETHEIRTETHGVCLDLISRAEAMSQCKNAENELTDEAERKGLRVARFIIGELPSAELTLQTPQTYGKSIIPSNAEVVEDYISRADAIEAVRGLSVLVDDEDFPCFEDALKALPSADAVDCTDFIEWLTEVVLDDEDWELNAVAYGEIICRKLVKLGVLEVTEEPSYYIRPSAEAVSREFYEDAVKANIGLVIENRELKAQIESADAVQGEWIWRTDIPIGDGRTSAGYICSNCGKDYWHGNVFDFCPNCGARMYKGGDDE